MVTQNKYKRENKVGRARIDEALSRSWKDQGWLRQSLED